ncbi:MAG TPA: APC family permease [Candidatus Binataceae bacterium]|nr:APC family permease [Candidatus Binataceae bacterium]
MTLASTSQPQLPHRIGLLPLICLIYLVVSGGAYGIEDAVGLAGPRLTLLLCAIIPLTLSLPTALMAAELTALIPFEGGFYFWVKEALGPFAGFAEVWLTLLFAAVDTAIYPVLFATYLAFLIPLGAAGQLVLEIALVWCSGLLNLLGVRVVGNSSIILTTALLAPFVAMVLVGAPHLIHWRMPLEPHGSRDFLAALGGGLTVVMWNYGGWENLSVVAGEIQAPQRNYLRAITIAIPLVALGYLLPLGVTLAGASAAAQWRAGWFAAEGVRLGGPLLGTAISVGGAISAFALFEAAILWVSRLPFVLAGEGYLPRALAAMSDKRDVPARSILVCCVVFTLLAPLGFMNLVVLDVFFYMLALVLEMAALIRLRRLQPQRRGLFVIGGGRLGLYVVAAAPLLTWLATFGLIATHGARQIDLIVALAMALAVLPAYAFLRRYYGGPLPKKPQDFEVARGGGL